ncbi:MAG: DUF6288 domain-containing protein, partial [Verrucomicrobiota bacterium]
EAGVPRLALGEQIGRAEASDGDLNFLVDRSGAMTNVQVTIPTLPLYAANWPADCPKSSNIVDRIVDYVLTNDLVKDIGVPEVFAGLFLLSTGDDSLLPHVKVQVDLYLAQGLNAEGNAWASGYQGILLAEYFLRTGDTNVLPKLQLIVDVGLEARMGGGWGHRMGPGRPWYVGGHMNPAGLVMFSTLTLARECGIAIPADLYQESVDYYYRYAGRGHVSYGDHRPELFASSNGKNGILACVLSLFDDPAYQDASEIAALMMTDSYHDFEGGHTGGGFNTIWRGLGAMHLPVDRLHHYRTHMDQLQWYYDLTRHPDGGIRILPSSKTRYAAQKWGMGLAMTYTAPRRALRILGAPLSAHGVAVPPPPVAWGNDRDLEFFSTAVVPGYGAETNLAHELSSHLFTGISTQSVAWLGRMLKHYNPVWRNRAAMELSRRADAASIAELEIALQQTDVRVRRAALEAIAGYEAFFRPMDETAIPTITVSTQLMPHIQSILDDADAAWWETDAALLALAKAEPADIRTNLSVIATYATHRDWYLREAAYIAFQGVRGTITFDEFMQLMDWYTEEPRIHAQNTLRRLMDQSLNEDALKFGFTEDHHDAIIMKTAELMQDPPYLEGFGYEFAVGFTIERTFRLLEEINVNQGIQCLVDELVQHYSRYTTNYHDTTEYIPLLVGDENQRGLLGYAMNEGTAGAWLIHILKQQLVHTEQAQRAGGFYPGLFNGQIAALTNAIAQYESSFGPVLPFPAVQPTAVPIPDYTLVDDDGDGLVEILLDGVSSFDVDGQLLAWAWETPEAYLMRGVRNTITVPVGTNAFILRVTDDHALFSEAQLNIRVVPGHDTNKPIKVFILAGQSNMEGKGWVEHLEPLLDDPETRGPFVHTRDRFNQWRTHDDVWVQWREQNRWGDLGPGFGNGVTPTGYNPTHIGPELQFGHVMRKLLDHQVLLIKTAWGGKSLAVDFQSPGAGGPGAYFSEMTNDVSEVLNNITNYFPDYAGQGLDMAGFAWFQGWNDAINHGYRTNYASNLVHLINDIRHVYGSNLPFVVGEGGWGGNEPSDTILEFRAQQS